MERRQITLVLNLFSISICVLGDAVAIFPPEARAVNQYQYLHPFQQFQPMYKNAMPQGVFMVADSVMPHSMEHQDLLQPILHNRAANSPQVPERPLGGINLTTAQETSRQTEEEIRAAKGSYDYPAHGSSSYPSAPSYGYSPPVTPGYAHPASATTYSHPSTPTAPSYSPAIHHQPSDKFFKSDLTSLIKPVTTKVASKVSGFVGLILSLLSSSGGDSELNGFKDIVINGIIKPLLIAKGGIKSLISKLTIPVISLLLINLEVLITVWWLWEDCPEPKPIYEYSKPTYAPVPPPNNYNNSPYR